jgi:ATP-dependent DNA helicase RecQ
VPAYVVFHDKTLHEIAARRPSTRGELSAVPGVGPAKLERYADELLLELERL